MEPPLSASTVWAVTLRSPPPVFSTLPPVVTLTCLLMTLPLVPRFMAPLLAPLINALLATLTEEPVAA